MPTTLAKMALIAAALAAVSIPARADIVITQTSPSGTPTGDGFYKYTYAVTLTNGQLDPNGTASTPQFATLYDFGPYANLNGAAYIATTGLLQSQFTFSFDLTDTPASGQTVNDNANLANVRLTYNGTTGVDVAGGATTLGNTATTVQATTGNLGTFQIYSPFATAPGSLLTTDGQTFSSTNSVQGNSGAVGGPQVPVPEPTSLMLLGAGLAGLGLLRRR